MSTIDKDAGLASDGRALERLKTFLDRFGRWKQEQMNACEPLGRFLRSFATELPELKKQEQTWEVDTAPRFNLFLVLRIQRKETKLHSRFLAELLDPCGRHCQGELFLRHFFDVAEGCGLRRPAEWPEPRHWRVTPEETVSESDRLDIVLRCPGFITVIENKVDAREGEKQLDRYYRWIKKRADTWNPVFLTPDGRPPASTEAPEQWICLSYHVHIEEWLRRAVTDIKPTRLRSAIEQYLQIIESL